MVAAAKLDILRRGRGVCACVWLGGGLQHASGRASCPDHRFQRQTAILIIIYDTLFANKQKLIYFNAFLASHWVDIGAPHY